MYFPRLTTLLALASGALGWEIAIYNEQNCNSGSNFDYVRWHTTPSTIRLSCCSAINCPASLPFPKLTHVLTLSLYPI